MASWLWGAASLDTGAASAALAASSPLARALVLLILSLFAAALVLRCRRADSRVELLHAAGGRGARLAASVAELSHYEAPLLFGGAGAASAIAMTIVGNALRRRRHIAWTRAQDVRLADGGLLRLQWLQPSPPAAAASSASAAAAATCTPRATLLLVPGTRGTAASSYIEAVAAAAAARGLDVVVAPLRGCGLDGELPTPHCLDGCHYSDLGPVVSAARAGARGPLVALGFSMGGGMLAHYLASCGASGAPCGLVAAVAVSATSDYAAITAHMRASPCGWLFQRIILAAVKRDLAPHAHRYAGVAGVSVARALAARSLDEWHTHFTCPLRGLRTPAEFVASVSFSALLPHTPVPLLMLGARADPITPADATPRDALGGNAQLVLARTAAGGHTAFLDAAWPAGGDEEWDTRVALAFLAAALAEEAAAAAATTTEDGAAATATTTRPRRRRQSHAEVAVTARPRRASAVSQLHARDAIRRP